MGNTPSTPENKVDVTMTKKQLEEYKGYLKSKEKFINKEKYIGSSRIPKSNKLNNKKTNQNNISYNPRIHPNISEKISSQKLQEKYSNTKSSRNYHPKPPVHKNPPTHKSIDVPNVGDKIFTEYLTREMCDPYNILKQSRNLTLEQLQKKYKKLAVIHHPDNNANKQTDKFSKLLNAYKNLEKLIKLHKGEQTFYDLKKSHTEYIDEEKPTNNKDLQYNQDGFNQNKFNEIFINNKLKKNTDFGYSNIMDKSSQNRDDIGIKNDIGKYTKKNFNKLFNKQKSKNTKEVVKFMQPKPIECNKQQYLTLGEMDVDDFTDNNLNSSYTDYKLAHENNFLIDTQGVNYKKYRDIKDLKKDRKNTELTAQELEYIREYKQDNDKIEWTRLDNLKKQDSEITKQYSKNNKLMLENNMFRT